MGRNGGHGDAPILARQREEVREVWGWGVGGLCAVSAAVSRASQEAKTLQSTEERVIGQAHEGTYDVSFKGHCMKKGIKIPWTLAANHDTVAYIRLTSSDPND